MAGVHGTDYYGKTEHVRGMFYVSTLFWHINFVPLFPTQSMLLWELPELQGQYIGKEVPMHWKSVLLGYLRGWLGLTAFFFVLVGALAVARCITDLKNDFWIYMVAAVSLSLLVRQVLMSESWDYWLWLGLLIVIAVSAMGYCHFAAAQGAALPAANDRLKETWFLAAGIAVVLVHGFTNLWTAASLDEALVYGEQLGLTEAAIKRRLDGLESEPFAPLQPSDFRPGALGEQPIPGKSPA